MACYPDEIFVDFRTVNESLLCTGCKKVANKTMITSDNVIYGESCLPENLKIDSRPMLAFRNIIDNLEARCANSRNCDWTGKIKSVDDHLKFECSFSKEARNDSEQTKQLKQIPKLLNMPMIGNTFYGGGNNVEFNMKDEFDSDKKINCSHCGSNVDAGRYKSHLEDCPNRIIDCPALCGTKFKVSDLADHISNICLEVEVDCPFLGAECQIKAKRGLMEAHARSHLQNSVIAISKEQIDAAVSKMIMEESEEASNELDFLKRQVAKQNIILESIMGSLNRVINDQKPIATINNRLAAIEAQIANLKNPAFGHSGQGTHPINQESELKILAQLEQIQQRLFFVGSQQSQPYGEPEFCCERCPPLIKLLSPKIAVGLGSGTMALLKTKTTPETKYMFRVKRMSDENIGVGFCDRKIAEQNNYEIFENDKNHNCYFITANSLYKRPNTEEWLGADKPGKLFREGDLIELVYSQKNMTVTLTNTSSMNKSLAIANVKEDITAYFPFVRLWHKDDSIAIHADKIANSDQFDSDRCGAAVKVIDSTECYSLGQGSACIFRNPIMLNFSYKFQAAGKQTVNFAIGVCIKDTMVKNKLEISEEANHGCFLFTSDGYQREHKVENLVTPPRKNFVVFGNSENLIMRLDGQSRVLSLLAYPELLQGEIRIPNDIELTNLYPCVQLGTKGDQLAIV
jgi:hypothetical protein